MKTQQILLLALVAVTGHSAQRAIASEALSYQSDSRSTPSVPRRTEHAATATSHAITASVIASGGGRSTNGIHTISGAVGQVDADPLHPATGNGLGVIGGFWATAPTAPVLDLVFANRFENP